MPGRIARRLSWTTNQFGHGRRVVRDRGWKVAVAERLGAALVQSPQWQDAQEQHQQRFRQAGLAHGEQSTRTIQTMEHVSALEASMAGLARSDDVQARLDQRISGHHELFAEWLRNTDGRIEALRDEWSSVQDARDQHLRSLQAEVDRLRTAADGLHHVLTDWLWAANAPLPARPLITVVMTTAFPERIHYLRSAIDSVLAQTYDAWRLIVIDDAAEPFLDPLPAWWPVADDRVTVLRGEGLSEGRARNVGVAVADGDVIAYLDDDCRWFPWWLHAVARVFATEADIGIVHGVRVIEADPGGDAWLYAQALDPLTLHVGNPADTNVMAHRRGLPDSDWPTIASCADYDTVVRMCATGARFVPVPAATYAVSSPSRAWAPERAERNAANFRTVQRRARRARPLRVVAHNGLYPLLSETYIGDELEALRRRDIDIVLSRNEPATVVSNSRFDAPLYESLRDAIDAHDPDLVLMHWAGVGLSGRSVCAEARVPYGIRLHSFDGGHRTADLVDHWCAGIWNFPHQPRDHHLAFPLDTVIIDPGTFDASMRSGPVLSLSAGLPKKRFDTFVEAMGRLPGVPFDVVMATTNGFETLPADVRGMIKRAGVPGTVTENMPFAEAQSAVRAAIAVVYALGADECIGQPRSVLEAAVAGTPLVVPEHAGLRALLGDTAHTYGRGDAASMARAIDEAITRPRSEDERQALSERVLARHSGDAALDDWANSLTSAVVAWQRRTRSDREGINLRWWWRT